MNWDQIAGEWRNMKGEVREQWGVLTDDEFERIGGNKDQLVGTIQAKYGIAKEEAERQVSEFARRAGSMRNRLRTKGEKTRQEHGRESSTSSSSTLRPLAYLGVATGLAVLASWAFGGEQETEERERSFNRSRGRESRSRDERSTISTGERSRGIPETLTRMPFAMGMMEWGRGKKKRARGEGTFDRRHGGRRAADHRESSRFSEHQPA